MINKLAKKIEEENIKDEEKVKNLIKEFQLPENPKDIKHLMK